MFDEFYKKSQEEILELARNFLQDEFYQQLPDLKNNVAIAITGSISSRHYDELSDIDLNIFFYEKSLLENYLPQLKEYKKSLTAKNYPLQLHSFKTLKEIMNNLSDWNHDNDQREIATALIVEDPESKFTALQKKFLWYPEDIVKEKVQWLFAESIFHLQDRYQTAMKRKDPYFAQVEKLKILQLLLNALLLVNHKFPSYDKHLYSEIKSITNTSHALAALVDLIIASNDSQESYENLLNLKKYVEQTFMEKHMILKETNQYWIDLRPKYQVQLG